MLKYPCLVLDHDNTAVQSEKTIGYPYMCYVLDQFRPGQTVTLEQFIRDCHEIGFAPMCRRRWNFTEEEIAEENRGWTEYIRTHIPDPFPGIGEIIRRQQAEGGKVIVVSHSAVENITRDYQLHFGTLPDAIYGWDYPEHQRKPYPFPLEDIMAKYGFSPEEILVVDDSHLACQMAHPLGIKVAFAAWGKRDFPELSDGMKALCDYSFDTAEALERFLFGSDETSIQMKYSSLLKKYGISGNFVAAVQSDAPAQEIKETDGTFTILLNPENFLPELCYEDYAAYCVQKILLPRLVLETDRLILRRFQDQDAEDCFAFLSNESGCFMDCGKAFSAMDENYYDRFSQFIQRDGQYAVTQKTSGKVIGTVNVFDDASRAVATKELGYCIAPDFQRKGYAFEALTALTNLLQADLRVELLVAGVLNENHASIALLEKLGFQKEGIHKKAAWHEGLQKPVDLLYYYREKTDCIK